MVLLQEYQDQVKQFFNNLQQHTITRILITEKLNTNHSNGIAVIGSHTGTVVLSKSKPIHLKLSEHLKVTLDLLFFGSLNPG